MARQSGAGTDLHVNPIHLGRGGSAAIEPPFTGEMAWYQGYGNRHGDDGLDGRLVTIHSFDQPWTSWEMHPNGAEIVLCLAGTMTLHQERADGTKAAVTLNPGRYAVNEPGTWHTADVTSTATALFITAGWGTEHRPR